MTTRIAPTYTDIAFAQISDRQKLDLYIPAEGTGPFPLVINIHGGAFMMGSKANQENDCASVNEILARGYAFASIGYRLSGEAIFPAGPQDCKAAIRWLKAHASEYNFNPDQFVLWGRSAGGHLAALMGLTQNDASVFDNDSLMDSSIDASVAAVVDWYGPSDFSKMDEQFREITPALCVNGVQGHDDPDSPESKFLGGPVQELLAVNQQANPVHYAEIATHVPPFFFGVGDSDCLVPHQQTLILEKAVAARGAATELHVLKDVGHAGPIFEEVLTPQALDWLDSVLASSKRAG